MSPGGGDGYGSSGHGRPARTPEPRGGSLPAAGLARPALAPGAPRVGNVALTPGAPEAAKEHTSLCVFFPMNDPLSSS